MTGKLALVVPRAPNSTAPFVGLYQSRYAKGLEAVVRLFARIVKGWLMVWPDGTEILNQQATVNVGVPPEVALKNPLVSLKAMLALLVKVAAEQGEKAQGSRLKGARTFVSASDVRGGRKPTRMSALRKIWDLCSWV